LLPTGHKGDEQVAAEFRRLTEQDLRRRKSDNLQVAIGALRAADADRVVLTKVQADALLVALTDTRLLLGERLGLQTEEDNDRLHALAEQDDGPLGAAVSVYDFLTWLQETLAGALLGRRFFGG
jgi:electron transfer flavoprotein alpha subunit